MSPEGINFSSSKIRKRMKTNTVRLCPIQLPGRMPVPGKKDQKISFSLSFYFIGEGGRRCFDKTFFDIRYIHTDGLLLLIE